MVKRRGRGGRLTPLLAELGVCILKVVVFLEEGWSGVDRGLVSLTTRECERMEEEVMG